VPENAVSDGVVREWLAARGVIAKFLADLGVGASDKHREELAASLIARLASHDPPLLIEYADLR
jgi:hypothetical protein